MTSIDTRHFEIGRRVELGVRSMPRSILIYGCGALIGAVALTALEVATRIAPVENAPVSVAPAALPIKEMPVEDAPVPEPVPEVSASREPSPPRDGATAVADPTMVGSPVVSPAPSLAFSTVKFPAALELSASSAFLIRAAQIKQPVASLVEWTALVWDGNASADPLTRLVAQDDAIRQTMRLLAGGPPESGLIGQSGTSVLFHQTTAASYPFEWTDNNGAAAFNAMAKDAVRDASLPILDFPMGVVRPVGAAPFVPEIASDSFIVTR